MNDDVFDLYIMVVIIMLWAVRQVTIGRYSISKASMVD